MIAAKKNGVISVVRFTALFVAFIRSMTGNVDASAVSLTSVTASFTTGGRIAFIVCGITMSVMVCRLEIPSAKAASYCPRSILLMPPR